MDGFLPQHDVALAHGAGLGACPAVLLMLYGLAKDQLQLTVLTRDQTLTALQTLQTQHYVNVNANDTGDNAVNGKPVYMRL